MEIEITDAQISEICGRIVEEAKTKFYSVPDYNAVEKNYREYVMDTTQCVLGAAHVVSGMREARKIGEKFSIFDSSFVLRTLSDFKAYVELQQLQNPDTPMGDLVPGWAELSAEAEAVKHLDSCFILLYENLDFAMLAPPSEHHIINDYPGSTEVMLHNANGPAILFPDGSKMYSLWDIKVDEKWVETPVDDLDIKEVLSIENVDERAVVLQRIGLHRVTDEAEVVDFVTRDEHPHGPYELLNLRNVFGLNEDDGPVLYLKMTCPSNDRVHVEGVNSDCESVRDAINWRASHVNWNPHQLDGVENPTGNMDQRQQGDVHLEHIIELPAGGVLRGDRQLQDESTVIRHTISEGAVYDYDGYQCIVTAAEVPIVHPEHNTVYTFAGVTKIRNGREIDHLTDTVRDLID
jgi:hypothetical protein